jgi:hypothetical protein
VITLDADTESVTSVVNVPSFANIESVRMFTDSTGPMKVAPSVTLIRCTSASRTDSSEIVARRRDGRSIYSVAHAYYVSVYSTDASMVFVWKDDVFMSVESNVNFSACCI